MMLGEINRHNQTVQIHPWSPFDNPTAGMLYPHPVSGVSIAGDSLAALRRYLPSNDFAPGDDSDGSGGESDEFSRDEFRMYEFKVRRCARGRSHDWTECPFAHPGEKAKRRDPRRFHYSGTACPDFRKGSCRRGDTCEFAHGVFECWLHPARYRTQPCKDGVGCRRRVCFFAHTPDQLRVCKNPNSNAKAVAAAAVESYDGSPLRHAIRKSSSPTSILVSAPFFSSSSPSDSPPLSPDGSSSARQALMSSNAVNEVLTLSLRQLHLNKGIPGSWGVGPVGSDIGPICRSLPGTPTGPIKKTAGMGWIDVWEGEEGMERVESGRNLRAKMFEKLTRENSVELSAPGAPDVGWVSELVK